MFIEIAVDPKVIASNWQNLRYIIESCGIEEGRLISLFPSDWLRVVYDSSANIKGTQRWKMEIILDRLKKCGGVIKSHRSYPNNNWLQSALSYQSTKQPFDAIITDNKIQGQNRVLDISVVIKSDKYFRVEKSKEIHSTSTDIAESLRLILITAKKKLLFIDPFFELDSRFLSTIKECLETAQKKNKKDKEFICEIHFRYNEGNGKKEVSTEIFKWKINNNRKIYDLLTDAIPCEIPVKIYCWAQKDNGNYFHDRFILSDFGGVSLGQGFCAFDEVGKTINLFTLDNKFAKNLRKKFDPKDDECAYSLIRPILHLKTNDENGTKELSVECLDENGDVI